MVKKMDINYDYYRIFYYVAKFQSFTQAANVLSSNQPNLTRTIKNLEGALGCKLFSRSRKGVQLTPEGEKLYFHVAQAVEHIHSGEDEILADQSLRSGTVTVAVSEIALHGCVLPALKKYRAIYPGVHVRVSSYTTPQAIQAVKGNFADFAVVTEPLLSSESLARHRIADIQEIAISGPMFADLQHRAVSLAELTGYPLIGLGPQSGSYDFFNSVFSDHGLHFKPDIEVATAFQIIPMVNANLGIGFVPENFLQGYFSTEGIFQLSLTDTIPMRSVFLLKPQKVTLSVAAKELEKMILMEVHH